MVRHGGRREPTPVGLAVLPLPFGEVLKKFIRDRGCPIDGVDRRFRVTDGEEPTLCCAVVQRVEQVADLSVRESRSEVLAGDFFECLGLVQDHQVVVGDDRRTLPAQSQIREEQGVVHDDELGILGPAPGLLVEAVAKIAATMAHAIAVLAAHLVPHFVLRLAVEITERTVGRRAGPLADTPQVIHLPAR